MTIGCPDCGALEELPPLRPPVQAICHICRSPLERTVGRSIDAALAMSGATLLVLIPANTAPLMTVGMLGLANSAILGAAVPAFWHEGWPILAVLVGAFAVAAPLARFSLLTFVLTAVRLNWRPVQLGRLYRWAMWLDPWAMPDVFLIGLFIGYSRVSQHLTVDIGAGGWCLVAAALTSMLTRATLDKRTVWRAIMAEHQVEPHEDAVSCTTCDYAAPMRMEGQDCPRCGLRLRRRKPHAVLRASALSLAALALYIPANLYPMTTADQLGQETPHRIIDGVRELVQAGLWPLAVIIFCTSIAIPLAKLIGMGWFVLSVQFHWTGQQRFKTHLYRAIDELGRWSFVDVFTLATFVPLMRFGGLASAHAEGGAPAFAMVVTLTMIASHLFDPRLLWDVRPRGRRADQAA
ncbi:MAG: paraquat-inducible protein A [Caulobacteraceae bacterium]